MNSFGKLNGLIKTWRDPYDIGFSTTYKREIQFELGLTVLVGCNGIGKTTLLNNIEEQCKKHNVLYIAYDNLHDGSGNNWQQFLQLQRYDLLADQVMSSEGERIKQNLHLFAKKIGTNIRARIGIEEIWILMDSVDSGFSIDGIIELKELFDAIIDTNKNVAIYIVAAANEYELARGEKCLDVAVGKYITFANYEEYRDYILKTKKTKDRRYRNAKF